MSVFVNCLDESGENYEDARYRAFQYFRMMIEPTYKPEPFTPDELEEPNWMEWEG